MICHVRIGINRGQKSAQPSSILIRNSFPQMESPEREIYRDPDVVRAEDRVDEVVHTDTARKMLSIFRQMEENACKKEVPNGPKPLKRFTPPPEDKYAKATASEEEEDEEGEESEGEDSDEERDPNYVRASDKVGIRAPAHCSAARKMPAFINIESRYREIPVS